MIEKKMLVKLVNMVNNISHPLHDMLVEMRSVFSSYPMDIYNLDTARLGRPIILCAFVL